MTGHAARVSNVVHAADARAALAGCEIAVPASAANLGPGFDTLGLALQLYLRVRVVDVDDEARNTMAWDFGGLTLPGENYIERGFRHMVDLDGLDVPALRLEVRTDIPVQSGLGSSAAATIAGIRLFERVAGPRPGLSGLCEASRLEGHADNVAAAWLGGLAFGCVLDGGHVIARSVRWPEAVRLVTATPRVGLGTPESRRVLPDLVPRADAVFNLQRTLMLVHALQEGDFALVREALRDRWHQPYRAPLVPGFAEALDLAHPDLLGVCLSGSGPTVLALSLGTGEGVAEAIRSLYARTGIPVTVRVVAAHQPGSLQ